MPGFAGIGIGRTTNEYINDVFDGLKRNIILISVISVIAYVVISKGVK